VFDFLLPASGATAFVGLIHTVGFIAAACGFFIIGAGLFARGLAPQHDSNHESGRAKDECDRA
jgi:hypothetical protein